MARTSRTSRNDLATDAEALARRAGAAGGEPSQSPPASLRAEPGIRTKPLVIAIGLSLALHAAILAAVGLWGFPAPTGPRTDVQGGVTLLDLPTKPRSEPPEPPQVEPPPTDLPEQAATAPEPTPTPTEPAATTPSEPIAPEADLTNAPLEPASVPARAPVREAPVAPAAVASPRSDVAPAGAPRAAPAVPVSFAGSRGHAASRIVYVIDASGAMTASLPIVKRQLLASVAGLAEGQSYSVIVPRSGARDARSLFGGGLSPATAATRGELGAWLSGIQPGGGSDVVAGLAWALELEPELVYVLTYRFQRTGVASEPSVESVLARLDALNPEQGGKRRVVIKTIQMIGEDPTGLLQAIAQQHGDGPGSYRVLELPRRR